MSQAFKDALSTPPGRRMLLELMAYCHALPETLQLGANHLLNHMQVQATKEERKKGRDETPQAKGRLKGA